MMYIVHCTEVRMIITNMIGFQHDDFLHDVPGMVKTWWSLIWWKLYSSKHDDHLNDVHGMVIAWWSLTWYTLYRGKHDDH